MTADQPTEATEARLWLGTVTNDSGDIRHDVTLWGPDDGQFGAGSFWEPPCNEWPANHLADLRPAVVVPQREDEGEIGRLAEIALATLHDLDPDGTVTVGQAAAMVRAVLAHTAGEVLHACPSTGSGRTPCCDRTPFDRPDQHPRWKRQRPVSNHRHDRVLARVLAEWRPLFGEIAKW
ncbi:hypothetical protein [Enterococcus hirae]|uniref:hypothetical protein n=1 Tax=Enterococcus hirae TaxID=1354 RepID=UPI00136DA8CB|nr:hypothetical protein [Enterococcus hirae]NAE18014.1 hypothetical protein [Enterococcus hirae]